MNKSSSVLESSFIIEDEESMVAFGGKLAEALMPGLTITLNGDLGAGKTTLSRGILRAWASWRGKEPYLHYCRALSIRYWQCLSL